MSLQSTQNKKHIHQALSPIVTALLQGLGDNLVSVVLFGSRARRDTTEASDWDMLVIARHLASRFFQRYIQFKWEKLAQDRLQKAWEGEDDALYNYL
jgi:predicted nucleotidyltransferase